MLMGISSGMNPVLLIVVPLGLAFLIPLCGLISKRLQRYIPVIGMVFNLGAAITLIPEVMQAPITVRLGGFPMPFAINLAVDPLAIFLAALIALLGLVISIYALTYINKGAIQSYHMLYLLLLVGATGIVLTGDIFNLFVFYEILCISSYALVAYNGDKPGLEAGMKYLIQGTVGSGLILIGIALIYGRFGTLNMAQIAQQIHTVTPLSVFVPLALLITGFGIEAAVLPLNAWLPDAHSSAPSSISAILSGIAIKMGLYAMIRVIFTIFNASNVLILLTIIGLLTLLIGEMAAFRQNNLKRMLAYSSIGQIGLIVFAFSIASTTAVQGALFQITSHAFAKALLFLAAGYMIYRTGTMDIAALEGIGRKMPLTSLGFTIGVFSLIGFPPFMGFASKFLIIKAALLEQELLFTILIGLVLLGTIIEGAYFFKVIQVIYFKRGNASGDAQQEHSTSEAPRSALIPVFILLILIIAIGVYPKFLSDILHTAAQGLLDRIGYIHGVLPL
jgi:proton-translocating NADH-quinone oxidoreductase chain N